MKKEAAESSLPNYCVTNYCNLNITGTVNLTRTGLPRCIPGFHFGIVLITRRASLSKYGSTLRTTFSHPRYYRLC